MSNWAFVTNSRSGSFDAKLFAKLQDMVDEAGHDISHVALLPDDGLPSCADLTAQAVDMLVVLGGDGTISALTNHVGAWDGAIVPLPGGTMNLLARRLHGDRSPEAILADVLAGRHQRGPVPIVKLEDICAICGVIAGPTVAWVDVREALRDADVGKLAAAIPEALHCTLANDRVSLLDVAGAFPALFVEPGDSGLSVHGIEAATAAELFGHAWAWLNGDFRDGPNTLLGTVGAATIIGGETIDLLIDGEPANVPAPLHLHHALSHVDMIATEAG